MQGAVTPARGLTAPTAAAHLVAKDKNAAMQERGALTIATPLAEEFGAEGDEAARARWMALVEKTLKGQSFDEALTVTTPDGLTIQPLYTARDGVAVARDLRPRDLDRPWDVRTRAAHPDPERAAQEILTDLENG